MKITRDALESIRDHGGEGYPEEICGIMLGPRDDRTVTQVRRVRNVIGERGSRWPELSANRRVDRYEMDDRDQIRIQKEADETGMNIVGYYHSHPDHPAQASSTDAQKAWAGYVYLIVAVHSGRPVDANAFVADRDGGPFRSEPLEVV